MAYGISFKTTELKIGKDFDEVLDIEVWGCAGQGTLAEQQKLKNWQKQQLQTSFKRASNELQTSFKRASNELQTSFERNSSNLQAQLSARSTPQRSQTFHLNPIQYLQFLSHHPYPLISLLYTP
ncbi:Protein CBG15270 [Caenorhabditis briggsae]|uniref:Protein CBG15270 n=1 Tax=Caenorhabditis briggsae TaxID=6238 RepID=A8XLI4_CAEBR|nr:Protein CBG15270 [Caenorhabditis briggsae]CAP33488.1 Protein CBG15270 [Caenorhabditis briggsae]